VIRFYKADAAVVTVKAGTAVQTERINGVVYEVVTTEDFTLTAAVQCAYPGHGNGDGRRV
jgi:hypothetical protein